MHTRPGPTRREIALSLQSSCHLLESHLGTWLASDALGMKEAATDISRMRRRISFQVCNSLYKSPKDRSGQRRVHVLGRVPHPCPRNSLPHCLLGTDNLYVSNNGNGHLIHQADSIHIPLAALGSHKSAQTPLCQPLLGAPVSACLHGGSPPGCHLPSCRETQT